MLSMLAPKVFNKKNFSFCTDSLKLKTKTALSKHADLSLRPSWSTNSSKIARATQKLCLKIKKEKKKKKGRNGRKCPTGFPTAWSYGGIFLIEASIRT